MDKKSNIFKSVLTLMSGSVLSQSIPILISPLLTRLFDSSQFGELAIFLSILNICAAIANGKYSSSILLPEKKSDINNLVFLNIFISVCFTIFLYVIIFLNNQFSVFDLAIRKSFLYALPLVVLVVSIQQVFLALSNKFEKYKSIAISKTTQSLTSSVSNLSLGYLQFGSVALVCSSTLAFITSTSYLLRNSGFQFRLKEVDKLSIKKLANKYKDFPLYTMPQSLLYQLVVQVPVFFIQDVYTVSILGFYALSKRVLTVPSNIISASIGQVYYKQASDYFINNKKEELFKTTRKSILSIFIISSLIALLVFSFLPDLFSFFFGVEWRKAGVISQYLLIYLVPAFSISPFTQIYLVSNNNKYSFLIEVFRFVLLFLLFVIGKMNSIELTQFFLYFSFIHTFCYAIMAIPILNKKSFIWS
jgi:O-antigen/teichoic acid export membrane protein